MGIHRDRTVDARAHGSKKQAVNNHRVNSTHFSPRCCGFFYAYQKEIVMQQQQQETQLTPQRPALRLVSTKGLSREEWLEVRKEGIGASDCAAALGINPFQSRLELWMNKANRDAHLPKSDPNDISSPMYWGNLLEASVADAYSHKTGNRVRRVNAVLQHPDPDKHWMLANLDFAVVGNDEVQILECKTTGINGARLWANGVPD